MAKHLVFVDDAMIESTLLMAIVDDNKNVRAFRGPWSSLVHVLYDLKDVAHTVHWAATELMAFAARIDRGAVFSHRFARHQPHLFDIDSRKPRKTINGLPRLWVTPAARNCAIELGAKPVAFGSSLWTWLFEKDFKK